MAEVVLSDGRAPRDAVRAVSIVEGRVLVALGKACAGGAAHPDSVWQWLPNGTRLGNRRLRDALKALERAGFAERALGLREQHWRITADGRLVAEWMHDRR